MQLWLLLLPQQWAQHPFLKKKNTRKLRDFASINSPLLFNRPKNVSSFSSLLSDSISALASISAAQQGFCPSYYGATTNSLKLWVFQRGISSFMKCVFVYRTFLWFRDSWHTALQFSRDWRQNRADHCRWGSQTCQVNRQAKIISMLPMSLSKLNVYINCMKV